MQYVPPVVIVHHFPVFLVVCLGVQILFCTGPFARPLKWAAFGSRAKLPWGMRCGEGPLFTVGKFLKICSKTVLFRTTFCLSHTPILLHRSVYSMLTRSIWSDICWRSVRIFEVNPMKFCTSIKEVQ